MLANYNLIKEMVYIGQFLHVNSLKGLLKCTLKL